MSDFRDYMRGLGHPVQRLRILPVGEAKPLYTDLYGTLDAHLWNVPHGQAQTGTDLRNGPASYLASRHTPSQSH